MNDMLFQFGEWLETMPWAKAMTWKDWMFPIVAAVHYFSTFLLMGTIVFFSLRLLGVAGKRQPIRQVAEEMFPWMWAGLITALISGFLLFSPSAGELFRTLYFEPKLVMIAVGIGVMVVLRRKVSGWEQVTGASGATKKAGLIALVVWLVALLFSIQVGQFVGN
jgi:cytochrome c-type biogenesis protein CcmH/NrfF